MVYDLIKIGSSKKLQGLVNEEYIINDCGLPNDRLYSPNI
jgi:hypothetical protein